MMDGHSGGTLHILLVRFLCGGYDSTSTLVVHTDGHVDSFGSSSSSLLWMATVALSARLPMVTLTLLVLVVPWTSDLISSWLAHCSLFNLMLRPSVVDCVAGLFFQSSVGLFPYLSIASLHRCLPVLSILLTMSLVEARPCRLL
jgi:hypothetical protein